MKAYLKRNFTQGFFLSEEGFVKLADICRKRMTEHSIADSLNYKTFRADSLVYETVDHREITQEENSKRNRITRVQFRCSHDDLQFELEFDEKDGVSLTIECNDKDFGYLLFSDIKDYLQTEVLKFRGKTFDAMFEHRIAFLFVMLAMLLLTTFVTTKPDIDASSLSKLLSSGNVAEKVNYLIVHANNPNARAQMRYIWLVPIGIMLIFAFIGPVLDKLYPRNVFYWGKMSIQYDRVLGIRGKIIWGVIVAFIISAIASLFVYFLTK